MSSTRRKDYTLVEILLGLIIVGILGNILYTLWSAL